MQVSLTDDEYYLLCILCGHLMPSGAVTSSLLDKFYHNPNLKCEDYDRLEFLIEIVKNEVSVQMKFNEFNLEK